MTQGRPPHEPTATTRRRVAVVAGAGWSQEEIAELLGIDRDTLAKHYRYELTTGAREKREEIIEVMRRKAKQGNVPAAKLYLSQGGSPKELPQAASEIVAPVADGIKAARDRAAVSAPEGSPWSNVLPTAKPLN